MWVYIWKEWLAEYSDIIAMSVDDALAELNTNPDWYLNKFYNENHLCPGTWGTYHLSSNWEYSWLNKWWTYYIMAYKSWTGLHTDSWRKTTSAPAP